MRAHQDHRVALGEGGRCKVRGRVELVIAVALLVVPPAAMSQPAEEIARYEQSLRERLANPEGLGPGLSALGIPGSLIPAFEDHMTLLFADQRVVDILMAAMLEKQSKHFSLPLDELIVAARLTGYATTTRRALIGLTRLDPAERLSFFGAFVDLIGDMPTADCALMFDEGTPEMEMFRLETALLHKSCEGFIS